MFTGIGTIVNILSIVLGGVIGSFLKKGFPERFKKIINDSLGTAVVLIGLVSVFTEILTAGPNGKIESGSVFLLIASLVLGGVLGEAIDIEEKFERAGTALRKRFSRGSDHLFVEGFMAASVIFCAGAMSIVGPLSDALLSDPTMLFIKSILDGVFSLILASTFGAGVAFSAVAVGAYQGIVTLLAGFIRPILTDYAIAQMSLVGGALVLGIGFNILGVTRIRVANLIPAIFIPVAWGFVLMFFF